MSTAVEDIKVRLAASGRRMAPPLSFESVAQFEAAHGITLPDDFREFLITVGNGGIGPPTYGLLGLGETLAHRVPHLVLGRLSRTPRATIPSGGGMGLGRRRPSTRGS